MSQILKIILLLIVFLTPLLGPLYGLGYEQVKVIFFLFATSLAGFIWLAITRTRQREYQVKWDRVEKLAAVFIVVLTISSLLGIRPTDSLFGSYPYFQGLILYINLFLFYLIVASTKIKLTTWAFCLASSGSVVAALAIKDWVALNLIGLDVPTYAGRVVSTFGQPNLYSGYLLLTLPFGYYLLSRPEKGKRVVAALAVVLSTVATIISQSRAAIILLMFLGFFALVLRLRYIKGKVVTVVTFTIALAVVFSLTFSTGLIWEEIIQPQDDKWLIDNSPEKRVYIWQEAAVLIAERPILGYGLDNLRSIPLQDWSDSHSKAFYSFQNVVLDRSHNYILDLLIFSGVLGLFAWLLLIWQLFKRAHGILLLCLLVYLIWIQLQIQSIVHLLYFWLLAALVKQNRFVDKE